MRSVWVSGARFLGLSLALAVCGCQDEKKADAPAPSATASVSAASSAAPAPSASSSAAPAPSGSADAAKGKMANCPNAVDGATTTFKEVDGGVEMTVKGKDEAAGKEIRARAAHLVAASKDPAGQAKHNGTGQGGGQYGRCPVVMKETQVAAVDSENGSTITVKVKSAQEVDWLRREARERQASLGAPGADGAGTGKMQHCPSAVEGASTVLKDEATGVLVTVTAKEEAATKEIRERAKHLEEAAKKDPKAAKHDGAGDGGGGLGRCPVVLKDTKVTVKEVPGGAAINVVVEKKDDVAKVQKDAKERAEKFQHGGGADAAGSASPSAAPAADKGKGKGKGKP